MDEHEIQALKTRVAQGGVYWLTADGVCEPVASVKLDWVEFQDNPDLTEPAALLRRGGAVALCNVTADSFVTLLPALSNGKQKS